jgi:hypothetical protein
MSIKSLSPFHFAALTVFVCLLQRWKIPRSPKVQSKPGSLVDRDTCPRINEYLEVWISGDCESKLLWREKVEVLKPRENPGHSLSGTRGPWIPTLRHSSVRRFGKQCVLKSRNSRSPEFQSRSQSLVVGEAWTIDP